MTLRLLAEPGELRSKFLSLNAPQDVADLLDVDLKRLYYHIYVVPASARYTVFNIPKRREGIRTISAPVTALKIIQRKLNQVLLAVYKPKPCAHSFLLGKSILSNAEKHVGKKNILNIDLKDFFPSINFGRVRGLFMGVPYNLNSQVATILAQICCFDNQLPQGAPTSPIITNMICAKMDSQLMAIAKRTKCDYTRYADDITFSTRLERFPVALATVNELGQLEVSVELTSAIEQNGFQINADKVRLKHYKRHRLEVTGIVVNKFMNVRRKYVRQIRAMLHAWEKFGLEAAEKEFKLHDKRHNKYRSIWKENPPFKKVVKGKIEFLGMVRGKGDTIYHRLCSRLKALAPELVREEVETPSHGGTVYKVCVATEGKSDWKHLKAAFSKLNKIQYYTQLDVEFNECEDDMGSQELLKLCKNISKTKPAKPYICIFDRDEPGVIKEVHDEDIGYKHWGNNVFSFAIPVPEHRKDTPHISIEFYYRDEEIRRIDKDGRRLFTSDEFKKRSGRHKDRESELVCHQLHKIKSPIIAIIDDGVLNEDEQNAALSKDDFAIYVLNEEKEFDDFDFSQFRHIFNTILEIAKVAQTD